MNYLDSSERCDFQVRDAAKQFHPLPLPLAWRKWASKNLPIIELCVLLLSNLGDLPIKFVFSETYAAKTNSFECFPFSSYKLFIIKDQRSVTFHLLVRTTNFNEPTKLGWHRSAGALCTCASVLCQLRNWQDCRKVVRMLSTDWKSCLLTCFHGESREYTYIYFFIFW